MSVKLTIATHAMFSTLKAHFNEIQLVKQQSHVSSKLFTI